MLDGLAASPRLAGCALVKLADIMPLTELRLEADVPAHRQAMCCHVMHMQ